MYLAGRTHTVAFVELTPAQPPAQLETRYFHVVMSETTRQQHGNCDKRNDLENTAYFQRIFLGRRRKLSTHRIPTLQHYNSYAIAHIFSSSAAECRTRNQVSPGSNPPLLPFRRLGIFVLSIDAPVHSAV